MRSRTENGFQGEYAFLSNMYPVDIEYAGLVFPSSETLYQWLKIDPNHPDGEHWRNWIRSHPGKLAKKLVRSVDCPLREEVNDPTFKVKIMMDALLPKFTQHEGLQQKLLATGNTELVEVNWWNDTFWGECKGKGDNMLGFLLMQIRAYYWIRTGNKMTHFTFDKEGCRE